MALAGCLAACVPDDADLEPASQPIVGGQRAETCQWPSAVMVLPVACSGVLVHPWAVITAKHCLVTPPTSIGIGDTRTKWAKSVSITRCYLHPTSDFGICTLSRAVTDVPIIPAMAPCERAELYPGAAVVEVGFGTEDPGSRDTSGIKKWTRATLVGPVQDTPTLDVTTGSQAGEYFGDSGGPLFFRMPDGTYRLVGEDCCSPNILPESAAPRVSTYVSVPYHLPWAEQETGLDLTPCHDATGWTGGAECLGYPLDPDRGGDWARMCEGQTFAPSSTCGGPDAGPWEYPDGPVAVDAPYPPPDAVSPVDTPATGVIEILDARDSAERPDAPVPPPRPDARVAARAHPVVPAPAPRPRSVAAGGGCGVSLPPRGASGSVLLIGVLLVWRRSFRRIKKPADGASAGGNRKGLGPT